jgi:hypothetical protein
MMRVIATVRRITADSGYKCKIYSAPEQVGVGEECATESN